MTSGETSNGIVLVADDSAGAIGMLTEALSIESYTVFVAMDGTQALAVARKMKPDIILMDAIMPNMDGFETCTELKNDTELCDIPVIFMTGLNDTEHVVKGLKAGGVDYLTKPVNINELLARLQVHLNNSKLMRSARAALDETGQRAFTCDINGRILWSTKRARELMSSVGGDAIWLNNTMPEQIKHWLLREPEKHSVFRLTGLDKQLQLCFLGRISPGEYLLRLQDDDEVSARVALSKQFSLTDREAEVLFWLAKAKTNREIAQILSMSPRTVNKHLEQIFKKMRVDNRTAAAAACLQCLGNR